MKRKHGVVIAVSIGALSLGLLACGSDDDEGEREAALTTPSAQDLEKLTSQPGTTTGPQSPENKRSLQPGGVIPSAALGGARGAETRGGTTSIRGTIRTTSGTFVTGAGVWLYRSDGFRWISLGRKAITNRGRYAIRGIRNGPKYVLYAYAAFGDCNIIRVPWFQGVSRPFFATGGARGANFRIHHGGYVC